MDDLANILAAQVTENLEIVPGVGLATPAMKAAFAKWVKQQRDTYAHPVHEFQIPFEENGAKKTFILLCFQAAKKGKVHIRWTYYFYAELREYDSTDRSEHERPHRYNTKIMGDVINRNEHNSSAKTDEEIWNIYEDMVRAVQRFFKSGPCTRCKKPKELMPGQKICTTCFVENSFKRRRVD